MSLNHDNIEESDVLYSKPDPSELAIKHYGTPRHSGRYPWGSGEDPFQHCGNLYSRITELKKKGLSKKEIADSLGLKEQDISESKLKSIATNENKILKYEKVKALHDKGMSNRAIAKELGIANESSVRSILKPNTAAKIYEVRNTANFLKEQVKEKKMIDIGKGSELYITKDDIKIDDKLVGDEFARSLNVSSSRLDTAVYGLTVEGYHVYSRQVPQPTNPGKFTTVKVLCSPEIDYQTFIRSDANSIKQIKDLTSNDGGETFKPKYEFKYPKSLDPNRLMIRYADDVDPNGSKGIEKDGTIEIRRGCKDLDLGDKRYAQGRILVGEDRYLKGMIVYSDNMPDGIDVIFNTNKSSNVSKLDVLKEVKKDPKTGEIIKDSPFGSNIVKQSGLLNLTREEGEWKDWSNCLPSQFLGKQTTKLAKNQLNKAKEERDDEYRELSSLENPTVKNELLKNFADNCDSAASELKAAAIPGQQYYVMVNINSLKDNEAYCPNFEDGTKLALVRYPHGGIFEIPIVTVNNKNKIGKELLGTDSIDGIGVNHNVAEQLSGADYDGDTVMALPITGNIKISSSNPLPELKGFDPKVEYSVNYDKSTGKGYDDNGNEIKLMSEKEKQKEMGIISNLINDMTLKGANPHETAKAVKHSMVVIDACKHHLDYKRSEIDNDIVSLKKKWQIKEIDPDTGEVKYGGASTLLSRASADIKVPKRQGTPIINTKLNKNGKPNPNYDPNRPEGAYIYKESDDAYYPDRINGDKKNEQLKKPRPEYENSIIYKKKDGTSVIFDKNDKDAWDKYKPAKIKGQTWWRDEKTGEIYFKNKFGERLDYKVKTNTQDVSSMSLTDDANTLVSLQNTKMEQIYAEYANHMKYLANEARKQIVATKDFKKDPKAEEVYSNEVNSLMAKLNNASKNTYRERAATIVASSVVNAKLQDNPDMVKDKESVRKLKQRETEKARKNLGSRRQRIEITEKEWEAIQARAISPSKLKEIMRYADLDILKSYAMPRKQVTFTKAQIARANSLKKAGRTNNEIAAALGCSVSALYNGIFNKEEK